MHTYYCILIIHSYVYTYIYIYIYIYIYMYVHTKFLMVDSVESDPRPTTATNLLTGQKTMYNISTLQNQTKHMPDTCKHSTHFIETCQVYNFVYA